jgi:ubiquinone/menaquinone biosynthesis C-methylase UbiE
MYYYPFNPNIHNLGNTGFSGAIHAEFAPIFTKMIDIRAYNGRNIRQEIIDKLENNNGPNNKPKNKILDLCCGIGISTAQYGIDTSPQMINKAKRQFPNKKFLVENAEDFWKSNYLDFLMNIDIVTCMFAFHEMPAYAHEKIINNSLRLASKEVIIVDLSPEYKSSKLMRDGEPYLLDYQKTIEKTMEYYSFKRSDYISNHVTIWKYNFD